MDLSDWSTRARTPDGKQMRIFHGLHNIAGIPSTLASAERKAGLDSQAMCFPSRFMEGLIPVDRSDPLKLLTRSIDRFDIFNFHFGFSFLGESLRDVPLLKRLGKTVLMHFHGCDIRDSKLTLQRHSIAVCAECWPVLCNANRADARRVSLDIADAATVSTPDLLESLPGAQWLPQAIDLNRTAEIARARSQQSKPSDPSIVRIVHIPSSAALKGTRFIEATVHELQQRGAPIEFIKVIDVPHDEVLGAIFDADIAIDQVLMGAYGVFSIEAMALGKPTICFLRDDLVSCYASDLPLVNADIVNLGERILELIERRAEWPEIGRRSIDYVAKHHDASVIASRLATLYTRR
jgi:hypothetical protein